MASEDLFKGSKDATAPVAARPQPQPQYSSGFSGHSSIDPPRIIAFAPVESPIPNPPSFPTNDLQNEAAQHPTPGQQTFHYPPAPYVRPNSDINHVLPVINSKNQEGTQGNGNAEAQKKSLASSSSQADPKSGQDDVKESEYTRLRTERIRRLKPIPPTSLVVEPFGGLKSPSPSTPVLQAHPDINAPPRSTSATDSKNELLKKPTCSLNLVCYSRGCAMSQIIVTMPAKFECDEDFKKAVAKNPKLITSDEELFRALRDRYLNEMCGLWRRCFSLKKLRCLRLLSYTPDTRPTAVPLDEFTMQEVFYAYNHPSGFGAETDWIEWVFRLRQPDKRHALEFVEGWDGTRIAVLGSLPCVASTLVGVIWSLRGGDVQTAFTMAGFILTTATVLLALLAVISGIDSKSR